MMISAYIDPGSGSVVLQVILGGAAGLGVAGKLFGEKLRRKVGRSAPENTEPASTSDGTSNQG